MAMCDSQSISDGKEQLCSYCDERLYYADRDRVISIRPDRNHLNFKEEKTCLTPITALKAIKRDSVQVFIGKYDGSIEVWSQNGIEGF